MELFDFEINKVSNSNARAYNKNIDGLIKRVRSLKKQTNEEEIKTQTQVRCTSW